MKKILGGIILGAIILAPPGLAEDTAMAKKSKNSPQNGEQCGLPMSDAELRKLLTPEQYRVMRENGTEAAFQNAFWNNKEPGIYVDRITGEPLFSSMDKFDSETGWPSFFKPIEKDVLTEKPDTSHGMTRTEVRSKKGDSHLGHVFPDDTGSPYDSIESKRRTKLSTKNSKEVQRGPQPTGLRYCINSAALRFIPADDLEKEGYAKYLPLFGKKDATVNTVPTTKTETATFAAGCFWGVEYAFRNVPGVLKTTVGYTGGHVKDPTYEQVCSHATGHAEAVRVEFDPSKVSYEKLLETFWSIHDPTTANRQGPDIGDNYRSAVFFNSPEQEKAARTLKRKLDGTGKYKNAIVTEIAPASEFYPAEDYHQRYYEKKGVKPQCRLPLDK